MRKNIETLERVIHVGNVQVHHVVARVIFDKVRIRIHTRGLTRRWAEAADSVQGKMRARPVRMRLKCAEF